MGDGFREVNSSYAESANICQDKELTFSKYDIPDRARGRIRFYLPLKKIRSL